MHPPAVRALAIVLAVAPLAAQVPAAATREAKVLALLQRIPVTHGQLASTRIAATTNAYGCAIVVPELHGLCGVGWEPAFDPVLARSLARELCAIYGLTVVADVPAPAGVRAHLDAFDAERGIGLELRGTVAANPLPAGGTWPVVVDEPADTDLDVDEHDTLRNAKVRVHTADVHAFWVAAARDRLTTTLCYLASVAAFLNEVTDGDDVDLSAIVPQRARWLPIALPKARPGLQVTPWSGGGGATLLVERALEVALPVDVARAHEQASTTAVGTVPNAGRPVAVQITGLQTERGSVETVLRQRDAKGREVALATSDTELLFAPGAFDATRPFTIVLALQPGQYRIHDTMWMSAPPAK